MCNPLHDGVQVHRRIYSPLINWCVYICTNGLAVTVESWRSVLYFLCLCFDWQCLVEKVQKLEELCSKKEKFLQVCFWNFPVNLKQGVLVHCLWHVFPFEIQFISRFYVQPSFLNSIPLLFNHGIRFSTSTFLLFNLDSCFLSSAFVLFKHNVCYLTWHSFYSSVTILSFVFLKRTHCASLLRTIFASSARAHGRVRVQNARDFPQTELENGINSFLLNERGDPRFFQVFAKNNLIKNIFKEEKKFDSRT